VPVCETVLARRRVSDPCITYRKTTSEYAGLMIMAVKIIPTDDGAQIVTSAGDQVWRKIYPSMDAATSEAIELQIIGPKEKGIADMSQPVPTYAQGFTSPEVEVEPKELVRHGFLLDS
jgi:hypothetical protein